MPDFENDIENSLLTLEQGGIILYPTDTVWGIGCDAMNAEAVAKIYALKKRSDEKSMIILLDDESELLNYVSEPNAEIFQHLQSVTKPTTFIYNNAINLAKNIIPADGSIAIRITSDVFCKELIVRLGKPLVSTSANISGKPAAAIFTEVDDEIKNGVDYIVQHRQDDATAASPSAIIKLNADGSLTIIRS